MLLCPQCHFYHFQLSAESKPRCLSFDKTEPAMSIRQSCQHLPKNSGLCRLVEMIGVKDRRLPSSTISRSAVNHLSTVRHHILQNFPTISFCFVLVLKPVEPETGVLSPPLVGAEWWRRRQPPSLPPPPPSPSTYPNSLHLPPTPPSTYPQLPLSQLPTTHRHHSLT